MQKIYFEKWVDLNHQLKELLSLSVDESINYKIENVGVRAIGSLIVKGEYNENKKFEENIEMDVLATFDKIVDQRDFNIKVEDFDYFIKDGDVQIKIEVGIHGVVEGEDGSQLFKGMKHDNFVSLLLNEGWSSLEGESGFDFTKRIFTKLDEITAQYPDENILIATHGGTILNTVVNIDHNFVNMDGPANCSITIIDCHGEYRVIEYNLQVAQ